MVALLLVGKDWLPRAPLRAQLIEEGLDVEAHETVADAIESIERSDLLPSLMVADLASSDDPRADIAQLSLWTKQIPIWVIAGRNMLVENALKGRGFEVILFRPVDVGELVEQIKQRLGREG